MLFTIEHRITDAEINEFLRPDQFCNWSDLQSLPKYSNYFDWLFNHFLLRLPPQETWHTYIGIKWQWTHSWENSRTSEYSLTMAVLWKLVAISIVLINSVKETQCSISQHVESCGPCWCLRAERKADCTSRNLTSIPVEIPEDVIDL